MFLWVVKFLVADGLISGQTVSIDGATLEANAAMKSIVRRDSGQSYEEYLKGLAKAAGMENPTREQLARLDRKREKKGSNQEWKRTAAKPVNSKTEVAPQAFKREIRTLGQRWSLYFGIGQAGFK